MIYFIRHGQTEYNKEGRFQGILNIPLNAVGLAQAEKAAESLKDIKIEFKHLGDCKIKS